MARKYIRHSEEFKRQAVQRMKDCASVGILAQELDVQRRLLYRWKEELDPKPKDAGGDGNGAAQIGKLKQEVVRLEAALGRKTLETDFFKRALQKVEARRRSKALPGKAEFTTKSGN